MQAVTDVVRDWIELTPPQNKIGCHRLHLSALAVSYRNQYIVAVVPPAGDADERMDEC
jgi:hypothetical protein